MGYFKQVWQGGIRMTKKHILLIDDEESFTHLLRVNLEATGRYEVRVENRGAWGLVAAREFRPDLILLDIVMPDLDGSQLAGQIQEDAHLKGTPIVYLTAIVSRGETHTHGGMIGENAFLAKPVSTNEVIACIEKYVGAGGEALPSLKHPNAIRRRDRAYGEYA